jgi:hypothetical protein
MDSAKIQISKEELRLVTNPEIILTKNRIIQKVYELFGVLSESYKEVAENVSNIPEGALELSPKISRGENYMGLPYVMLDYPRSFSTRDVLALRTMFWWGHHFSVTLHLKGSFQDLFAKNWQDEVPVLAGQSWWMQIGEDEWQHHQDGDTHLEISTIHLNEWRALLQGRKFLKMACYFPLEKWDDAESILLKSFTGFVKLLRI